MKLLAAASLPLLRGAVVSRAPTILQNYWFYTIISDFFQSSIFGVASVHIYINQGYICVYTYTARIKCQICMCVCVCVYVHVYLIRFYVYIYIYSTHNTSNVCVRVCVFVCMYMQYMKVLRVYIARITRKMPPQQR